MTIPQVDIRGKPFTERDRKLLELLLRPNGATKYELNVAAMKRVAAHSFKTDSERLATRALAGQRGAIRPAREIQGDLGSH
jgi:hypothetical protein